MPDEALPPELGELDAEAREAYVAQNPGLTPAVIDAIKTGNLIVVMQPAEVTASWGAPYEVNKFSDGKVEEWIFGCDYPHFCVRRDHKRRFVAGTLFDGQIHLSKAYFEDGKLTEWSR